MNLDNFFQNKSVYKQLIQNVDAGRVPHAQLFVGPEGAGMLALALAYAKYILANHLSPEQKDAANKKVDALAHSDLHFIYPNATNDVVKKSPKSIDFISQWREFVLTNPFANEFDWYKHLDIQNKQGEIRVDDAQEVLKSFALKSYEGGYKIMIIWMAEKLNIAASNKLLKIIEEPYPQTLFLLISQNDEDVIQTIRSRCQTIKLNKFSPQDIVEVLTNNFEQNPDKALEIATLAQGNMNIAIKKCLAAEPDFPFEMWFVNWVRNAFKATKDKAVIIELIQWAEEIASIGREAIKLFLKYCIEMFRNALLINYQTNQLAYIKTSYGNFDLNKFAPFVHNNNIHEIIQAISDAIYHIERNANAKIVLTDMAVLLTRLIHKKSE